VLLRRKAVMGRPTTTEPQRASASTRARSGSPRQGFRPDVEGLRAVAVLAVVFYHAGVPGIPGGYVGVDVFFVLSGFLITGLLYREVAATGRVSFSAFYARRVRRLLPAAMLVLVVTQVASARWLLPLEARSVAKDSIAAALYGANYRFAAEGTNYLAASGPPSPVQHYWSLGVEEQFYLVWPVILLLAVLTGGRWRRGSRAAVAATLVAIAVGSFMWSLGLTTTSPPWAFYSLPSRAWELAAGGLVALAAPELRRMPRRVGILLGWAGLGAVLWACIGLSGSTPFPGVAALAPVLGAVALVAAGGSGAPVGAHVLLSRRPLPAVGRMSYSWYLWHWPVLILGAAIAGHSLNLAERLLTVVLSAALALGTLVLVENPIRFAPGLARRPRRGLVLGATLTAGAVACALATAARLPALVGHGPEAAPIALGRVAAGPVKPNHKPSPAATSALTRAEAPVVAAVAHAETTQNVPPNLHPSLGKAAIDKAAPFFDGCALTWTATYQPRCAYADTASRTTVMLFGDSHAAQWFPTFDAIARARHWRLESLNKTTCPPLELPIFSPYLGRRYTECEQWRQEILARVRAEKPALVVLGVARHYTDVYHFTVYSQAWLAGITQMVREIRAAGSPVLLLGPIPKPPADVPTCLSAHLSTVPACDLRRTATTVDVTGMTAELAATRAGGGRYLNVIPLFCTASRCPVIVGDNLVYRDDNHLTTAYASWLAPVIAAELDS
jgi:peptidoglycan/LPS O-acetylase OafA/YrhL